MTDHCANPRPLDDVPVREPEERSPEVCVLLPALRVDDWLRLALESVLNDGYERIEVVLILDGLSEAPPLAWLQDERVRVLPLAKRGGVARALNAGLSLARSEFVARMDADDVSLPGRFGAQVQALQADPLLAAVGCQVRRIDEAGRPLEGATVVPTSDLGVKRCLLLRNAIAHPTVMFRRSALVAVGGYSVSSRTTEDYDLYLRLALQYHLGNLPDEFLEYRVHTGQVSRSFNPFTVDKLLLVLARQRLARRLGVPVLRQSGRDGLWYVWQIARWLGLGRWRGRR